MLMNPADPQSWRYPADRSSLESLLAEEPIRQGLESTKALRERNSMRTQLLGGAVMVEAGVLPHLAEATERLTSGFPQLGRVECFVYSASEVNAFVTTGRAQTLVAVSSWAVNHLTTAELAFVLGHELGHVLFGHTEIAVNHLVERAQLPPSSTIRLRAWQRASEISADRAGLLLCGSVDAAAHALFKAASGIVTPGITVSPVRFAGQWSRLLTDVIEDGQRDFWQVSHPLPPLRMQAMLLFWDAWQAQGNGDALAKADAAVGKMLAMMDPAAGERTLNDPILGAFFFWGGLFVALADGQLHEGEHKRLESVAPPGVDAASAIRQAQADDTSCLASFRQSQQARRRKLTAVELHRILYGLIDVASADGQISDAEIGRLRAIGAIVGVPEHACDVIIAQYQKEVRGGN